jgi:hypothetical protein
MLFGESERSAHLTIFVSSLGALQQTADHSTVSMQLGSITLAWALRKRVLSQDRLCRELPRPIFHCSLFVSASAAIARLHAFKLWLSHIADLAKIEWSSPDIAPSSCSQLPVGIRHPLSIRRVLTVPHFWQHRHHVNFG